MLGDPANFIDPDGRAGIPFLQDFMKSDGGTFLLNLAGQATFLGAMLSPLGSIGGTLSNIVSIGASLYSTGSSVKNLAEFTCKGSTKTYARYDFSADFSMMKSSRHAGMAFDVGSDEENIGRKGEIAREEPKESRILIKVDLRSLITKIKKMFGVKEYSNTRIGGFVLERYDKTKVGEYYEIVETITNAGWGGKQTYRRTAVKGTISIDYQSWVTDEPNTSEGVNIEIKNNGKGQLIMTGTEMNTSTGEDFPREINFRHHGGTAWFDAPYDVEITVEPTSNNVQYEINIWKKLKRTYYVRRTRFRKLYAG
jgi:hypothetical protein